MIEKFLKKHKNIIDKDGGNRLEFCRFIFNRLANLGRPVTVLETGTMWVSPSENGMGAFTYMMADFIKTITKGRLITVDISQEALNTCIESTKEFADIISYCCSDSVQYLKDLKDIDIAAIDLFYLDSFDLVLTKPRPAQEHHLKEVEAIIERVSPNVVIAVDDNFLPGTWVDWLNLDKAGNVIKKERVQSGSSILGKATLINDFLLKKGWRREETLDKPAVKNVFAYLP